MDKKDTDVGTGLVGAPECGDIMKLQIKVDPQTKRHQSAKFKTLGSGSRSSVVARDHVGQGQDS